MKTDKDVEDACTDTDEHAVAQARLLCDSLGRPTSTADLREELAHLAAKYRDSTAHANCKGAFAALEKLQTLPGMIAKQEDDTARVRQAIEDIKERRQRSDARLSKSKARHDKACAELARWQKLAHQSAADTKQEEGHLGLLMICEAELLRKLTCLTRQRR
jgi:septal ring factor EnvC (AmiA/AmiB activator)